MMKQADIKLVIEALELLYPNALCALNYSKPYELIIAARLSAQCTDARVNLVTKPLFEKYPSLRAFADAEIGEVAEIIKPCGLFRTKAESIVKMANMLYYELNGVIPSSIDELVKLPGIGRKTANLIMGDIFHKPAIVTDTHFIRICGRLGFTDSKEPEKVENDLRKIIPPEKSSDFCHRIVLFGRDYCTARNPKCENCPLKINNALNGYSCKKNSPDNYCNPIK